MKYTRRNVYCYLKRIISFSEDFMSLYGIITLLMTVISLLVPCLYQVLVDRVSFICYYTGKLVFRGV